MIIRGLPSGRVASFAGATAALQFYLLILAHISVEILTPRPTGIDLMLIFFSSLGPFEGEI